MADISEIYTADSGLVTVASTAQTALFELRSSGTVNKRAWVTGVRLLIGNSLAAGGNNVLFTLARVANTPSGGTAVTPNPHSASSPAAITGAFKGSWVAAPTLGAILGEWEVPQSSGAMWAEFPPLGYEWSLPVATASLCMFVTASVNTSTPIGCQFIFSE